LSVREWRNLLKTVAKSTTGAALVSVNDINTAITHQECLIAFTNCFLIKLGFVKYVSCLK